MKRKKLLCMSLVSVMGFALAACGSSSGTAAADDESEATTAVVNEA